MNITIWDSDWTNKFSHVPNPKAMKISSYHKQQGDMINFVQSEGDLSFAYDLMYIIREKSRTPFPPSKYIDRQDVRLIGSELKFYEQYYELEMIIEMCRPDYMLYPLSERNAYANAHVIQFLHKKDLLPAKQDYINTAAKGRQKALVVDEHFWNVDRKTILKMLEELKSLKNVAFLKPISLKKLISDQEIGKIFLELNFGSGTIFNFRNDYGSELEQVKQIVDYLVAWKSKNPHVALQGFPVKAFLHDHWSNNELGIKDFERCLAAVDYGKRNKIQVIIKKPRNRLATPFWVFFEILQTWTTYAPYLSYVDAMLHSTLRRNKLTWHETLNNPLKWSTPRVIFFLHLLITYPDVILNYGLRKWGDDILDKSLIDINQIVKKEFYFDVEKTLEKLKIEFEKERL